MKTSHVYCLFSSCRRKQPGQEHLHRSSGKYSIMFFLFYYLSKEINIYICFVFRPAMMDMCEKMWNFSVPKTQGRQPTNSRENCNAHARRVRFLRRSGRGGGPRDKSVKKLELAKIVCALHGVLIARSWRMRSEALFVVCRVQSACLAVLHRCAAAWTRKALWRRMRCEALFVVCREQSACLAALHCCAPAWTRSVSWRR